MRGENEKLLMTSKCMQKIKFFEFFSGLVSEAGGAPTNCVTLADEALCERASPRPLRGSLRSNVSVMKEKNWETNLTYRTDSSSTGREETVTKPACDYLAVDSAAAEVGPGG